MKEQEQLEKPKWILSQTTKTSNKTFDREDGVSVSLTTTVDFTTKEMMSYNYRANNKETGSEMLSVSFDNSKDKPYYSLGNKATAFIDVSLSKKQVLSIISDMYDGLEESTM